MPSDLEKCECGGGEHNTTLESSVCSNHFKEIELTSSPVTWKHSNKDAEIMLSGSRQEFLPGEPGNLSYQRKGGIFVTNAAIVVCILATAFLCTTIAILVHLYWPIIIKENPKVEDDLSWDIGKLHIRDSEDKIRLLTHVIPTYYRLKIKPNYVNYTFEGYVSISLHTHKVNVKHIALHAKDLEIENTTIVLTEQVVITDSDSLNVEIPKVINNKTRRHARGEIIKRLPGEVNPESETPNDDEIKVVNSLPNPLSTTPPTTTSTIYSNTRRPTSTIKSNSTSNDEESIIVTKIRKRKVIILSANFHKDIDRIVLALESHLSPGVNYTLEISFKGKMDESLTGFYRSTFKTSENKTETLFVTQFEPISARKAFPCFDEPFFKAMFEISIARPVNATVLSNMPLVDEEPIDGEDLIWSHFERSQLMSPYLVAYSVSNLVSVEVPQEPQTDMALKIWTRPELKYQTKYAVEVTPKILKFYEDYFGLPYALPKLDLLGIPDFAVGAMENWGMMTFRETSLLLDPDSDSLKVMKGIAMVIAHELAHQWFGNLVTMQWWTDIWLNEGFATYLEYIAVDAIEPSWELLEQFLLDRMQIMAMDSLETTRPVSSPINDEIEISQVFDDIAYMKAASLLRMLNNILSEEVFHNGIVEYMTKWQYKNADQSMLWDAFTAACNETILPGNTSIADFMNSWTLQSGYPVLNVTRNYEDNTVTVTQNRFYFMTPPTGMTKELWYVPISYIIGNVSQEFWDTSPKEWLAKTQSTTIQLPEGTNDTEIYFNVHGIGHYRVNYDKRNWKLLQYKMEDKLNDFPVSTRAQILDDALNLARAGQLEYSVALSLTKHMSGIEMEMLPWLAVLDNLGFINKIMKRSSEYSAFQEYISYLIMPTLEKLGYEQGANESSQVAILRDQLIYWACLIEEEECVNWVWDKFYAWKNQSDPDKTNPIPYNNRATVYATVVRLGTQKEYNYMFERFLNSNDPEVQADILGGLTHSRYQWILHSLFNYSITTMELQLVPILWSNIEEDTAANVGFDFIIDNWPVVYSKLSQADDLIIQSVIDNAFAYIYSEQKLRQFKRFVQANKNDLKATSNNIHKNLERAVLSIHWRKTKMEKVEKWLVKFRIDNTKDVNDLSTL